MAEPQAKCSEEEVVTAMERWFPPQWFSRFAAESGWSAQKLLWMGVLLHWVAGHTLTERFRAARDLLKTLKPRWRVPSSLSGYLAAWLRVGPELQDAVVVRLREQVRELDLPPVLGWRLFGVDGSRFECPRTKANERVLGCAGKEHTTPQLYQTTLWELGSELPWDVRVGPGIDSEQRQLDDMLDTLPAGSLLTADANFISFGLCSQLLRRQVHFLLRVGGNRRLLTELGGDHEIVGQTVYLWPEAHRHQPPVTLRLIVITTGKTPVYLLTDLLDPSQLSDAAAAELYRRRWGGEVYYRTVKRTFPFAKLASRSPYHAQIEQRTMIISLWLLQLTSVAARREENLPARRWSGATARMRMRDWLRRVLLGRSVRQPLDTTLAHQLATAVTDTYQRRGPKQRRHWPRKKSDSPPTPPKQRPATKLEREKAKQLWEQTQLIL